MGADRNFVAHKIYPTTALPVAVSTQVIGSPTNINTLSSVGYEFVVTGGTLPKGTFDIQISLDHTQIGGWTQGGVAGPPGGAEAPGGVQVQPGNWLSLLTLGLLAPAAPAFAGAVNNPTLWVQTIYPIPAAFIRWVYTTDSTTPGTGNLTVWVGGKIY